MSWPDLLLLSLANASMAFTITETKLFAPLRVWTKSRLAFLGEMFSCGYCLGHWTAFGLTAVYRVRLWAGPWPPLDYFLTALVIAWLSAFQWIALCWLMQRTGK